MGLDIGKGPRDLETALQEAEDTNNSYAKRWICKIILFIFRK